jgi:hypothetical protein
MVAQELEGKCEISCLDAGEEQQIEESLGAGRRNSKLLKTAKMIAHPVIFEIFGCRKA